MYVTTDDLNSNIYPEIVDMIASGNDQNVAIHINSAISNVRNRLIRYYDINSELAKTGENRNQMLVNIVKDIAIFNLYSSLDAINNIRVKRYDEAIKLLNEIQQGKTALSGVSVIVTSPEMQEGFATFQIGSQTQRPNEIQ